MSVAERADAAGGKLPPPSPSRVKKRRQQKGPPVVGQISSLRVARISPNCESPFARTCSYTRRCRRERGNLAVAGDADDDEDDRVRRTKWPVRP